MGLAVEIQGQFSGGLSPMGWFHRTKQSLSFSIFEYYVPAGNTVQSGASRPIVLQKPILYQGHWTYHANGEFVGRDRWKAYFPPKRLPAWSQVYRQRFSLGSWTGDLDPEVLANMKSTLRQPPTHTIKIPAQALRTFTLQLEVIGAPWTNVLYDESNFAQDATGQV